MKYQEYKSSVDIISHLILTRPKAVNRLLHQHGKGFLSSTNKGKLIGAMVDLMAKNTTSFNHDFEQLLDLHITENGAEMMAMESDGEDEFLGAVLTGIGAAKSIVGASKGLFGRRKRRKKKKPSASVSIAQIQALQAQSKRRMEAQAAQMKLDMQRKLQQMELEKRQEARRREQREEERKREVEKAREAAKNTQMAGLGNPVYIVLAALGIGGLIWKFSSRQPVATTGK